MKEKIKSTSKKYIILPIAALGMIAVLTLASADTVSAQGRSEGRGEFASVIAQKFGLDQAQVEVTMQEFHQTQMQERHQEREALFEEKLQAAISQGELTETQMQVMLEKHDEMQERMEELHDQDISREDHREMMADIHEEMQAWAEEQGINMDTFMNFGERQGFGESRGFGRHNQ